MKLLILLCVCVCVEGGGGINRVELSTVVEKRIIVSKYCFHTDQTIVVEREQRLASYNQLLDRNNTLTRERDQLLERTTNLTRERDQLLDRTSNLTKERDQLLTRFEMLRARFNLTEKDTKRIFCGE